MTSQVIKPGELEAIIHLPETLRSEQSFNDLQHSMLVILFRHALKGVRAGNAQYTDRMMDTITIYLFIHFLAEEEGMAYSMNKGIYDPQAVAQHACQHLHFLQVWRDEIFAPHKANELTWPERYARLESYYGRIIRHIDKNDQNTYGAKLDRADKNYRAEIAFVARSRIPLSPYMAGALETVSILDPATARLINANTLSELARRPLGPVTLTHLSAPVIEDGPASLRDRFYAHAANARAPSSQSSPSFPWTARALMP